MKRETTTFETRTFESTSYRLIQALALLLAFVPAVLAPASASAQSAPSSGGCKPYRCLFDNDCSAGVCKEIRERPVQKDVLRLGATAIRTTEITDGPRGSFKVEALKGAAAVASLEWRYSISRGVEQWTVRGTRLGRDGKVQEESLVFDTAGKRQGRVASKFFFELSDWLFRGEGAQGPGWLPELGFSAGVDQWQLLSKDDCVSCDFPGCNCS